MRLLVAGPALTAAIVLVACGVPSDAKPASNAHDQARDELAGTSYQDQHGTEDCTGDCSGHDAGFHWAQENGVEDPSGCLGNSTSFEEGCQAYGRDLQNRTAEIARRTR